MRMPYKQDFIAALLAAKEQGIGAILAFIMAYLRGRYNGGAMAKTLIDAVMCAMIAWFVRDLLDFIGLSSNLAYIKALMKQWKGAARLTAITATRQIFDSGDVSAPIKSWQLYVKTVDIDADSASVTLSVTNPLNNNIGRLYDPVEYTGLQYL